MADHDDDHGDRAEDARVTSPMQDFTMGQVTTGLAVFVVGLVLTFGVALALT